MKITRVTPRAVAEPGGREYLVVRVDTDEGVPGYAETETRPAHQVAVGQLRSELQRLVGMDPARAVRVGEDLRRARASLGSRMVDGSYPLPDKPGLGIDIDERVLAKYPFGGTKPFVVLPVHEDGSIASP